jgi:2-dehydro-3-deoxygalactonokinase
MSIQTFMTGELFDLLSQKTILASSIEKNDDFNSLHVGAFEKGVQKSLENNFLHACFNVRTNEIFSRLSKKENYHFLSGLVIGAELKELKHKSETIFIVGNSFLQNLYKVALQQILSHISIYCINAEEAILKGQLKIYKRSVLCSL